ncbi:MAG: acetyl-CoA hydrolase, partial [Nocardia sp.]|nr:acetyl-CoA hydrolase [Nocardia sp.]
MSESTVDLAKWLRPGDRIVLGQACGEPTTLLEALIDQGPRIGGLSAFTATSFSGLFAPGISRSFAPKSMG